MQIMIINCHTANRGDEAAVKALADELIALYPDVRITLGMRGTTRYPNLPENVKSINQVIVTDGRDCKYRIAKLTKGIVTIGRTYTNFISELRKADFILHAPGGPSIGDTYYNAEASYLYIYDLLNAMRKPYMFYAPSMGPFHKTERNEWRRSVLNNAKAIVLRDPISAEYVKALIPDKEVYQTLDSAFQHDIDRKANGEKFNSFSELNSFLRTHSKCVGVTITDLLWHPVYSQNQELAGRIQAAFEKFLGDLAERGYGILFIPQLYGTGNDSELMQRFTKNNSDYFVIPDNDERYDAYFQQYVIGQLFAVIGMRYHSNIFSAKMGTPFLSVSYEQKMQGFMEKMELSQYCIKLENLSSGTLSERFEVLIENYSAYKAYLNEKHVDMKAEAYRTTEIVREILEKIMKDTLYEQN